MTRTPTPADIVPTNIICPTCDAVPGRPCRTRAGKLTTPHRHRRAWAYVAWLDAEAADAVAEQAKRLADGVAGYAEELTVRAWAAAEGERDMVAELSELTTTLHDLVLRWSSLAVHE